ncbi:MAG: T9SS type A sorting domain-containing protein [Muribaculaceae bacterium]|nr:T9SS type A sorting domain-containing protein [Muribaculaceae bacterium]
MADWSADLKTNMPITDYNKGNASTTHVARTKDGKFWVTWISWEDDMNARLKAQLLDKNGNKLLDPDGVYVSNQITAKYHTNYGMAVTPEGDLIVCHSDSRNDPGRHAFDPYVYRMDQEGNMLWGLNGVKLPTSQNFGGAPYVAVSDMGSIMVGYNDVDEPSMTFVLMKMNPDGTMAWDEPVRTQGIRGTLMPADDDNFYMTLLSGGLTLYKVDSLGDYEWSVNICSKDMNTYAPYPAYPDGNGGVLVPYFYYVSLSIFNNGLQHVTPDGEVTMGIHGMDIMSNEGQNTTPGLAYNGKREEVVAYWSKNMGTAGISLWAQKYDYYGIPLWDEPVQIGDTHPNFGFNVADGVMLDDGSSILFYGDCTGAIKLNLMVEKLDKDGNSVWKTQIAPNAYTDAPAAFYEGDDAYFFWNDNRNIEVASVSNPYGCVFGQYLNLADGTPAGVRQVQAASGAKVSFDGSVIRCESGSAGFLTVCDMAGVIVASCPLQPGINEVTADFAKGVYVVCLTDDCGKTVTKIVK